MKWINTILISVATILPSARAFSQIDSSLFRSWSAGITLSEYGYDGGLGVEITSPGLLKGTLCLRSRSNAIWMEDYKITHDRWATYYLIELLGIYQFPFFENTRPYVEIGIIEIIPGGTAPGADETSGLTGRVGLEMFIISQRKLHIAYYINGGGNLLPATPERARRYADGFIFSSGLRFYVNGKH